MLLKFNLNLLQTNKRQKLRYSRIDIETLAKQGCVKPKDTHDHCTDITYKYLPEWNVVHVCMHNSNNLCHHQWQYQCYSSDFNNNQDAK